jgi:hypothetical protein
MTLGCNKTSSANCISLRNNTYGCDRYNDNHCKNFDPLSFEEKCEKKY